MAKKSFIPATGNTLKSMIHGILESYAHPWDILAELTQNSIDAVRQLDNSKGHIEITVSAKEGRIHVKDNGIGINPSIAESLMRPYGSNKRGNPNSIGEKGVGLKFVIFSSDSFKLTSHHRNGSTYVSTSGANKWLNGDGDEEIFFDIETSVETPSNLGTEIEIFLSDKSHPLFQLSFNQLEALIRTKTAIGSTKELWDSSDPEECDCLLTTVSKSGRPKTKEFDCRYMLPIDIAKKKLSISEYDEWRLEVEPSDDLRRKKLKGAVLYNQGTRFVGTREIKFWSCMMPSRGDWYSLSNKAKLVQDLKEEDYDLEEHFFGFHSGAYLSTKGMPTAVTLDLKARGESGYTANFFVLIEDPDLAFDIGRKGVSSLAGRTIGLLREIANDEFKKYLKYKRFLRGEVSAVEDQFAREDIFAEIDKVPNIQSDNTKFLKLPNEQEATVAAMFYEQIGKGNFEGFKPILSGYRDKYDLTGMVGSRKLILEFKYSLSGLLRDFGTVTKLFNEINTVVVWELTSKDISKAKERGITVLKMSEDDTSVFPVVHHNLMIDNVAPIELVELKKVLEL